MTLASVSGAVAPQQSADSKKSDSVVGVMESDNGKDIDITTGQTLRVKLQTIAGNGYSWTVSGDPAPLKLTKSYTQKNSSRRIGGGEMSVLEFTAGSPGLSNLTLVYRRSWEYNVPPAKRFSVRVNVR